MKITGDKRLARQFKDLPKAVQEDVRKAVRKSALEGERVAKTLVPVSSGHLKGMIHTKFEPDGMRASVEAAPNTKEAQIKARSVEHGRKSGTKGTTDANPYIQVAQAYLEKRFKGRVSRAINKAAKRVTNG